MSEIEKRGHDWQSLEHAIVLEFDSRPFAIKRVEFQRA